MEIIYIDLHFFLNLVIDYLLCLVSARICGVKLRRLRYLAAALLGAVYSVAVFLPGMSFLSGPLWKLIFAMLMAFTAYAREQKPLRCALVFLSVSAAFGGAVWAITMASGSGGTYLPISFKTLFLSFAICYAVISLVFRCRVKLLDRVSLPVKLRFMGKEAEFLALRDTGNSLSDPVSGSQVMVVSPEALRPVFEGSTPLLALNGVELMELSRNIPELQGHFRLIPYSAVGSSGVLAAFRPEALTVDGAERDDILIALSTEARGEGFEAII